MISISTKTATELDVWDYGKELGAIREVRR